MSLCENEREIDLFRFLSTTASEVTIEECAENQPRVGAAIDTRNVIESSYRLEVSSPGIDKPLKLLRQYNKNNRSSIQGDVCKGKERSRHHWYAFFHRRRFADVLT